MILRELHSRLNINVYVDEIALNEAGISLDHRLTMVLDDVSAKLILDFLLRPLHLTYTIREDVLEITTEDRARGGLRRSVYAVDDLLGNSQETDAAALRKLITSSIEPRSWSAMGGAGSIEFFSPKKALVITQTPDIQDQVAELLAALRRLSSTDKHETEVARAMCDLVNQRLVCLRTLKLSSGRPQRPNANARILQRLNESEDLSDLQREWEYMTHGEPSLQRAPKCAQGHTFIAGTTNGPMRHCTDTAGAAVENGRSTLCAGAYIGMDDRGTGLCLSCAARHGGKVHHLVFCRGAVAVWTTPIGPQP
jgi:hypothetical protein